MNVKEEILIEAHYLPNLQYFSKLVHYPVVWIEQQEHYQKGSYRNRCHLAGANGLLRLSIPLVKGKNEQQKIQKTQIAYHEPWQQQHWSSIQSAYGNAPYFEYYAEALAAYFEKPVKGLFEWNLGLIHLLIRLLQLEVSMGLTDQYKKEVEGNFLDLRNSIHPKSHRRQVDDHFQVISYPQVFMERHGFLPNLSILDLLFCTGPQAVLYLEQSFISH